MSGENSPPPSPSQRRASFAPGTKLSDMFGRNPSGNGAFPGSIAAAAANASAHQKRRMSISTLGLSGSPNQTSPFNPTRPRQESLSSTSTSPGGDNESAIDDSADGPPSTGSSPFARRMSFGARAMRDARSGQAGGFNGRASSVTAAPSPPSAGAPPQRKASVPFAGVPSVEEEPSSPSHTRSPSSPRPNSSYAKSSPKSHSKSISLSTPNPVKDPSNPFTRRAGEGFNWSDQMRSRAERSASITAPPAGVNAMGGSGAGHTRANTVAAAEQPAKEVPKQPKAPDHFQERILKGDFYMD